MFVVIFEVQPKKERWDDYLALAQQLRPKLEAIDGFIANERFKSLRMEGKLLSLSIWRDEKAVIRWRTHGEHHDVQRKGRFEVFEDYHLRVGEIVFDSDHPGGIADQQRFDETEIGAAKAATITELAWVDARNAQTASSSLAAELGLEPHARDLRRSDAAEHWRPAAVNTIQSLRHRQVRVVRDYGMFERREAPQYYEEVSRGE